MWGYKSPLGVHSKGGTSHGGGKRQVDGGFDQSAGLGKSADGGGLFLDVRANGSRYWRMKYRHAGKERLLSFGVYPEVSLAEARRRRDAAREAIRDGKDPGAVKRARKVADKVAAANSFEAVACEWLDKQRGKLAA